jgi:hypothetical protein
MCTCLLHIGSVAGADAHRVHAVDVDFVIVPSFWFHCFYSTGGPHWKFLLPQDYAGTWETETAASQEKMSQYWSRIREAYGGYGGGRALIVVHHAFVMDTRLGSLKWPLLGPSAARLYC